MNCEKGDLAILVMCDGSSFGRLVRCVTFLGPQRVMRKSGEICSFDCWLIDPPLPDHANIGMCQFAPDAWLRPIRDPGDDAVDESKAWLPPVPLPTIEPHLLEVGK